MRLIPFTLWVLCLLPQGCAPRGSAPEARVVTGPNGSQMLHISCGGVEANCFELAGQRCPQGYQYVPTAATQHPDDHNLFVRCNQPAAVTPPARPGQPYTTYPQPTPAPARGPGGVDVGY